MSAPVIQAEYEVLDEIAKRFEAQSQLSAEMYAKLSQNAQQLVQGGWQGRGIDAFAAEMSGDVFPGLQRLIDALQEANSATLEISTVIRAAEEEAASLFQHDGAPGLAGGAGGAGNIGGGNGAGGEGGAGGGPGGPGGPGAADSANIDLPTPVPTSEIFSEQYMEDFIGTEVQGADSPRLNELAEKLLTNPTGQELDDTLNELADLRGVPRDQFRAQYERYQELGGPGEIDLSKNGDFLGSTASLRYGQVAGDALGVDPLFAALLNPTGGLVGPGDTGYHPGDNDPIGYHGIFHDAAGYLFNYHDIGPGYDYLGQEPGRPTSDPLTGQLSGTRWWLQHRELDPPGPDFIVENPLFYGPLRTIGAVGLDVRQVYNGTTDGFGSLFDGDFGQALDSFGSAAAGAGRIQYDILVTTGETVVDTVDYVWDGAVGGAKAIGGFLGGLL